MTVKATSEPDKKVVSGCRLDHRQACSGKPTGRALMGRPSNQSCRSSRKERTDE